MELESEALKLIKAGKGYDERLGLEGNREKMREENKDHEKSNVESEKAFDCAEYYKSQGFDLKNEIKKEKCIKDFFMQKYRIESEVLDENKVRDFLEEKIDLNAKNTSSMNLNEATEGKDPSKNLNFNIMVCNLKSLDPYKRAHT